MSSEKRMMHDYEVLSSIKIGDKEIVVAMDTKNAYGHRYMCGYVERDPFYGEDTSECIGADDYAEVLKLYGTRIAEEAQRYMEAVKQRGIPNTVLTEKDCIPDNYTQDINGKVIAIDAKILRPEYQRADEQLYFVIGGFGASANARGSAVFATNLYTGKNTRWERYQVLGEVKPESLPEWAKEKANALIKAEKKRNKEAER